MEKVCKICGKEFSERGLHGHLVKAHDLTANIYYETHYPRCDKLTAEPIPYTDYQSYFDSDFVSKKNLISWLKSADPKDAREYMLKVLKKRVEEKELKFAPSFVEIETTEMMPPYRAYIHFFGSYLNACKEIGIEPLLNDRKNVAGLVSANPIILIDSREQQPLSFKRSRPQKLAFGDYTLAGEDYSYTYVDRKSESDFKSTVTVSYERFLKEIGRAVNMDCYIFVVVESSLRDIELNNPRAAYKANMKYVWASMRRVQHSYPRKVQFIFTGSRENSERIIPYLLRYGKTLWDVDVQYLLKEKGII
jgi:hypothetical protein